MRIMVITTAKAKRGREWTRVEWNKHPKMHSGIMISISFWKITATLTNGRKLQARSTMHLSVVNKYPGFISQIDGVGCQV